MNRKPNTSKVVLFVGDMNEQIDIMQHHQQKTVTQSQLMRVDNYHFTLQRSRNSFGVPYGASSGNIVDITVSVGTRDSLKVFYERLSETVKSTISLLFNVVCDQDGYFTPECCDGVIVLEGYIVDIQEQYDTVTTEAEDTSIIKIKLLADGITVVGSTHNISFSIN